MEGVPSTPLVPWGYVNSATPFFYPRPEVTNILSTIDQVYVSPQGNDDVSNNGNVTSPFATISAALFYVTTVSATFPVPLSAPVCIFVAPGTYEGGFAVPDNVYLIGPSNSPQPVNITGNIFISPTSSSATIGLQNLTLESVTVAGAFYDANLEMRNCTLDTNTIFSALTLAPEDELVTATVTATECVFRATDAVNAALISATTSEKSNLTLDNCQLVTAGEEGTLISITGSLTVRNSSLINTAAGTTLAPLILAQSGATLTPVVSLEGSVLKYNDVQTDAAGNKLAIKFNAPTQPITASMTNCTVSVHLGGAATDIVKNIGAANVTFTQSANSCLEDGITIDTTNMVLPAAFFLQDSPLPSPPSGGVTFLNSIAGAITLAGAGTVSVGAAGSTITITGNVAVDSVGGKTGVVTFAGGTGIGITYGAVNGDPITVTNSLPGPVASGTIDQTGFTLDPTTSQYYKAVTVSGMTTGGLVLATANGTPGVCISAWITTVIPTTNTITIWLAANPVVVGETWEAHYVVTSY